MFGQTYDDFEVIILDDCSTDNSRQVIDSYANNPKVKHIVYNQVNSGSPFIQWAKGISLAKGDYIWIAESDDYAAPTFLEKVMKKMDGDPERVICYTASNIVNNGKVDETGDPFSYYKKLFNTNRWSDDFENDGENELINYMGGFCTIVNASGCVFKKSAFPIENQEIYKFKYCGDWLIWMELFPKGKIVYIREQLNYFRIHEKSTVNKFLPIKKSKEFYHCLLRARHLTKGKSVIPQETLDIVFHMWTYTSLYFFLKNFRLSLLTMHYRIDKSLGRRVFSLFKNYYSLKLSKS